MRRAVIALVLIGLLIAAVVYSQNNKIDVPGCRGTKFPEVCVDSFHKCENIGLDDACLAVAKLEGEIGHSVTHDGLSGTSQNMKGN